MSHTNEKPALIAITGGPCSGKSTLIEKIKSDKTIATQAEFVPEAASLVLPGFLAVKDALANDRDSWWQYSLQLSITRLQYELEETYVSAALQSGKKYVICDRGILDAEAYTEEADSIYASIGHTAVSALRRYHMVMHMESVASSAPHKYGSDNNPSRYEHAIDASQVEERTLMAWAGHPRREFIAGHESLEGKISTAVSALRRVMNLQV